MWTTLKRGVGRAATVNGNGRAVLPPGALRANPPLPAAGAAAAFDGPAIGKVFGWIVLALLVVGSQALPAGLYLTATRR